MTDMSKSESAESEHSSSVVDYPDSYWSIIYDLDRTMAIRFTLECLDPRPGEVILDVGCGTGRFMVAFEKMQATAVGLDRYRIPLESARPRVRGRLVLASGECLPFASESFDKVLCYHVLEHMKETAMVLGEIHRVLRPNGLLVLAVPNSGYFMFRLGLIKQDPRHLKNFDLSFSPAGFRVLKKRVFLSSRFILIDRLAEALRLSKWPGIRGLLYNAIFLLEKS